MPTFSSHVLDSVHGTHAAGLRVEARIAQSKANEPLFDIHTDEEGRFTQPINVPEGEKLEIEIVFHTREYFQKCSESEFRSDDFNLNSPIESGIPTMDVVVIRMNFSSTVKKYHAPLVLSPHSYTLWWS